MQMKQTKVFGLSLLMILWVARARPDAGRVTEIFTYFANRSLSAGNNKALNLYSCASRTTSHFIIESASQHSFGFLMESEFTRQTSLGEQFLRKQFVFRY